MIENYKENDVSCRHLPKSMSFYILKMTAMMATLRGIAGGLTSRRHSVQ